MDKSNRNKLQDIELLAIPLSIGMAFLFCWVADLIFPKDIATLIALFSSVTFGRYSRKIIQWIIRK